MLERQLGAPLFERGRQGVRLTPVGTVLLPHARRVLAEWDAAWEAAGRAKSQQRATLVVGMSTSPGRSGLLPAIRSRFTAAHPEARVNLHQVSWDDPTAGLADGTADVAFVWLPVPDPGRYRWVVVAEEPRLVAMPPAGRREHAPDRPGRRHHPPRPGPIAQPGGTGLAHRRPPSAESWTTHAPASRPSSAPDEPCGLPRS